MPESREMPREELVARIAELEALRCDCDEDGPAHSPTCVVSIREQHAAMVASVSELERERDALRSEVERLRPWARFGARAFEDFWQDGDPGDLEGGDLQEMARDCGLLGRTAEVDAGATHADGCDWQPGMHVDDCDCWAPLLAPYTQEDSNAPS